MELVDLDNHHNNCKGHTPRDKKRMQHASSLSRGEITATTINYRHSFSQDVDSSLSVSIPRNEVQ
eukprot:scaffold1992_cov187-Amphora_coffeaeformis.AAC.8